MSRKNPHVGGDAGADVRRRLAQDPELAQRVRARLAEYDIANQIKKARVRQGLTQEELGRRSGTAQTVIARIERGANLPKLELLTKIATALGCRITLKLTRDKASMGV